MALASSRTQFIDVVTFVFPLEDAAQRDRIEQGSAEFKEKYQNDIELRRQYRTVEFLGRIEELVRIPLSMFPKMTQEERDARRPEFQRKMVDAVIIKTVALAYTTGRTEEQKEMSDSEKKVRRMVANDVKAKLYPYHLHDECNGDLTKLEAYFKKNEIRKTTPEDIKNLTPEELTQYKKISLEVSKYFANEIENLIDDQAFDVVQRGFVEKTKQYYDENEKVWKNRDVILVGIGGYAAAGKEGVFTRSIKKNVITSMPVASGTTGIAGHQANGYQEWEDFYGMFDPMRAASELLKDKTMMLAVTFELEKLWGKIWNKNVPMFTEGHPRGTTQPKRGLFYYIADMLGVDRLKYLYLTSTLEAQTLRFTFRILDGIVGEHFGWKNDDGTPVTVRKDDLYQVEFRTAKGIQKTAQQLLAELKASILPDFLQYALSEGVDLNDRTRLEAALMQYKIKRLSGLLKPLIKKGELKAITEDTVDDAGAKVKSRRKIDEGTQSAIQKSLSEALGINVLERDCSELSPEQMDEWFASMIGYNGSN